MNVINYRLCSISTATFLVMHFTGAMVSDFPYIINGSITSVIVLSTLLLLLRWGNDSSLKDAIRSIGLRKTNTKSILPGIILVVVLLLSYPLLSFLLDTKTFLAKDWYLNLAGLFLTGGLTEEILFRGYFFGSLRRQMSFRKAVLISAIFFSLTHLLLFTYMDWPVAFLSTLLAVASAVPLAFLYEFGNKTVWSPALAHTAIRTIGLVVTTDEEHFMQFSLLWIIACITLPYIVLLFYKDFRTIWSKQF
jgi:membrane protease YdiL (CAAX protease family)